MNTFRVAKNDALEDKRDRGIDAHAGYVVTQLMVVVISRTEQDSKDLQSLACIYKYIRSVEM